ncbi:thioesterase II family protein [Streptomyces avermitilis]|uniref:thioesterase II family protein n=1 Tax=Streptomyces avermitilis TaxID=33903 RepID=UPI003811DA40
MPDTNERLRLLCLPYAGGSTRNYLRWQPHLGGRAEIVPLNLPGRGRRSREEPPASLAEAAERLVRDLAPGPAPYALFGHSMGALVAYEMARLICRQGIRQPEFVVVAACRPPHLVSAPVFARAGELDDQTLLDELAGTGHVPSTLRDSPMRAMFVPALRADLALLAGYTAPAAPEPLPVHLAVWSGTADPLAPPAEASGWSRYSSGRTRFRLFDGAHFFVQDSWAELAAALPLT